MFVKIRVFGGERLFMGVPGDSADAPRKGVRHTSIYNNLASVADKHTSAYPAYANGQFVTCQFGQFHVVRVYCELPVFVKTRVSVMKDCRLRYQKFLQMCC